MRGSRCSIIKCSDVYTFKIAQREAFTVCPEECFQSGKAQGFQTTVGTSGILYMTAWARIYYACKACIPVWLGVCVCQHLCKREREKARQTRERAVNYNSRGEWQWVHLHSHNHTVYLHVCYVQKAQGSFAKVQQLLCHVVPPASFLIYYYYWKKNSKVRIAVEDWISQHTFFFWFAGWEWGVAPVWKQCIAAVCWLTTKRFMGWRKTVVSVEVMRCHLQMIRGSDSILITIK